MTHTTTDRLAGLRGLLKRFTTPLLPDDYSVMLNPLWSTRELRGTINSIRRDGEILHLEITPGWGMPTMFEAGQYIGIGVEINGRYTWRSYSLTNTPGQRDGRLSISVRPVEKGKLSNHLATSTPAGTTVRLAAPAGDFYLTNPLPKKLAFITAGTGITPVISMLRTLAERNQFAETDVQLIHSVHSEADSFFVTELRELERQHPQLSVHIQITADGGRVTADNIAQFCPDITERTVYACGPTQMLDDFQEWGNNNDVPVRVERFSFERDSDAQGGTIDFGNGRTVEVDGATTILEAGESIGVQLPFGCRMGICHTCTRTLDRGNAINLVTGEEHEEGARLRTCVSVASGDICVS
ncbi:flavodoxin reductase family protein [Corynebacterium mustelae]|uniref:Flavodoxin reductase family protein n=1 Tax=Corynebacterium mustelae TaxID=571915 RepID=A0A0G3H239_9CORY|nr:ferredoxin reductase [Corynebacterium mustelae]AKK05127.1 flavodoxin reductase family protein [Corynebacterium mustelae]